MLLPYLLKVSLLLAVLTLAYRWLIQYETFSKVNRVLLWLNVAAAWTLPLIPLARLGSDGGAARISPNAACHRAGYSERVTRYFFPNVRSYPVADRSRPGLGRGGMAVADLWAWCRLYGFRLHSERRTWYGTDSA